MSNTPLWNQLSDLLTLRVLMLFLTKRYDGTTGGYKKLICSVTKRKMIKGQHVQSHCFTSDFSKHNHQTGRIGSIRGKGKELMLLVHH